MTVLCGWLPAEAAASTDAVVDAMGRALRAHREQRWGRWSAPGLGVGLLEVAEDGEVGERYAPAVTSDGRYWLWMAGEAISGDAPLEVVDPEHTRSLAFRQALLAEFLRAGPASLSALDGEYQIVVWDARERTLALANDRFGGLPLYWARSAQGFAFAGGVRGVLMAPGLAAEPDPEAIREAVTFGGYRLGDRTNVLGVKMLPGATVITVRDGTPLPRRYWGWGDIGERSAIPMADAIGEAQALWQRAVRRRLAGAKRPGQALSGGLDSRAILAEAAPLMPRWTAITYGVPGCDDARYAERAAGAVGAVWHFFELYSGRDPDWLERRAARIQETDGLIQLADLMHLESLPLQAELLDVHLSGYAGDAISGSTFNDVTTAVAALSQMPYYETPIGLGWARTLARLEEIVTDLRAPARFALFEHKLPQSTNRWSAAWRAWFRVRKPFMDYAFFDFCQSLPAVMRGAGAFHERWLASRYPQCFARIPNQKTGMPVLTPSWRVQLARARRYAWRHIQPPLAYLGLPARPRIRSYHQDDAVWRVPGVHRRIQGTILRPGSLVCEVLGRAAVTRVLKDWAERAAAPAQVIGSLYVFEVYHRELAAHLRAAGAAR